MSVDRRDYIERVIEECAQAMAQVMELVRAGQFDPALILIHRTADAVLGPLRPALERLDADSAVDLLGPFELDRLRMYAALLSEEGAIHERRGRVADAQRVHTRALDLYSAIAKSRGGLKSADWERIAELRSKVGTEAGER